MAAFVLGQAGALGRSRPRTRVCRVRAKKDAGYESFADLERDLRAHIRLVEGEPEDGEDTVSPISYARLAKFGRFDLLEGVMKFGGYSQVAREMGLDVIPIVTERRDPNEKVVFKKNSPKDADGFLTLGGAKAERLSEEGVTTAFKVAAEKEEERRRVAEERAKRPPRPSSLQLSIMTRLRAASFETEKIPDGEKLDLDAIERLALVVGVFMLAAAFGRLGQDNLTPGVVSGLQVVLKGAAFIHVPMGLYGRSMAQKKNRNPVLWTLKTFVLGSASLQRLLKLPALDANGKVVGEPEPAA